ncbi:chymotrypsin family serine protease [Streptomyces mayteni]
MPASPELLAVKQALEAQIFSFDEVTGIDIGYRDEEAADPEDLAIRIFVRDADAVPPALDVVLGQFPVPLVIVQRTFESLGTLPDTSRHRPLEGGVSVVSDRGLANGVAGTLGALARTTETDPPLLVGLSNHHVLAVDSARQFGDAVMQPEPGPAGVAPGDRVGELISWAYPELLFEGTTDAAICTLQPTPPQANIADIGPTAGTGTDSLGMQVRKRGRTTGLTFGIVTTEGQTGGFIVDCPRFPAVNDPNTGQQTTRRRLVDQFLIRADFVLSPFFSDHGDSGAVVVDTQSRIVGLLHGHGYVTPGDPSPVGVATPIGVVEQDLRISLTNPI